MPGAGEDAILRSTRRLPVGVGAGGLGLRMSMLEHSQSGSSREGPSAGVQGAAEPSSDFSDMDGALAYLYSLVDLERLRPSPAVKDQYKLDRMRALARALGNPQDWIKTVHVAGTKGKGSTCEMVGAMLEGCGYTVGSYTSPHVNDVRERIRINRQLISPGDFVRLAKTVVSAALQVEGGYGRGTFFELTTMMAFVHFAEQAVDVAVIEVGLGGRLDCTNIITPEVSAVATIGYDHMEILGQTLELIAAQKGGIFKPGVPALTVVQDAGVVKELRRVAGEIGAPLVVVGEDVEFSYRLERAAGSGWPQMYVHMRTGRGEYDFVPVPMAGEHQAVNCGLALGIVDALCGRGFVCPMDRMIQSLATARLPGRFEVVGGSPAVVLDGAHNPESVRALVKTLVQYLRFDALVVVFGVAADKHIEPMLQALAGVADKVVFTRAAGNKRSADPAVLQKRYRALGGRLSFVAPTVREALEVARKGCGSGDAVCVTGSFYVVGEARAILGERRGQVRRP